VYFSTSDNSDPRTNGRCYEIVHPTLWARLAGRLVSRAPAASLPASSRASSAVARLDAGMSSTAPTHGKAQSQPAFQYVPWKIGLWKRLGLSLAEDAVLLDFGCGEGECVDQFRKAGYSIFGCDVVFNDKPDARLQSYLDAGIIRGIRYDPYRIPFDDHAIDLIFSNQVLEHVMDYDLALAEMHRVLKPDGVAVHIFPGRWKTRESHVFVPFASVIKSFAWLYLWALMGVRNEYQAGMSAGETARRNRLYLTEQANYLTKRQIRRYVLRYFEGCRFAKDPYFYPAHAAFLQRFLPGVPRYMAWLSDVNMRVLVFWKKRRKA
jgi:SAM-dependent methyltransferase